MQLKQHLRAVIQAGGCGTRLAPYSTVLPKALMPVGDGALIDKHLEALRLAGVETVFITVREFGPLIRSYCGDGSRWDLCIEYLEETKPLGTAGPLDGIRHLLTDTFLLANSDVYCDLDFADLLHFHRASRADLTVVAANHSVKVDYGVLDLDSCKVVGFREKPAQTFTVNAGIYCLEPEVLNFVPRNGHFGVDELIRSLLHSGSAVRAYLHHGRWIDVGTIEDLREAQRHAGPAALARGTHAGARAR